MKLMKRMSTFVVALTFLFVFSIKANATETYKVGDKVIFGDFGGHVIEDSDSNSNTVKVYVDGWNKTKEEWQTYWTNKFTNSDGYINYSDIDMLGVIRNNVQNKNSLSVRYMSINDLKFEKNSISNHDFYYTNNEIPNWLLEENYNLYGKYETYDLGSREPFESGVISDFKFGDTSENYNAPLIYHTSIVDEQQGRFGKLESLDSLKQRCAEGVTYYSCNVINDINFKYIIAEYNYPLKMDYPEVEGATSRFVITENKGYIVVTLDKSNIELEKCADYSDTYKITYETNGGDKIDAVSVTGNKELTTPKRVGYIFDGWYTDSNYSTKISSITPTQKKTDTCIAGYNDVTVYAKWKKELTSDKVSILGEEKTLENVSSIAVKLLDKVTANIVGTLKTFTAYDITLKDADGKSVEPSGKVKLSLEIPKDYDKNNIGVYREDGEKLIEYTATINGEYAEIETDHFSTYIVGEKAEVKEEEKTTTKVTNETISKDDSNIQNPKTGDNMIIFFIVGLLLVGGIAIVLRKLKTVK